MGIRVTEGCKGYKICKKTKYVRWSYLGTVAKGCWAKPCGYTGFAILLQEPFNPF